MYIITSNFYFLLVRRIEMRFLLPLLAFFSIVFAISTCVLAQDTSYEGVVTGDNVNLRAGAGVSHKSLMKMRKGARVTVVGKKQVAGEEWLEVEVPSDVFLYISQRYVQKKDEKGQIIGVVKTEEPGGKVNLRTGVEADDEVLGNVNNGDTVQILGAKDGWYYVVPPKGITAWLRSDYVKKTGGDITPALKEQGEQEELLRRYEEIEKKIQGLKEEQEKIRKVLEERERKQKELERKLEEFREIESAHEKRVEEIDKRHQAAMERLGGVEKPRKRYVAEGIVDDFGNLSKKPPASYRLRVTEDGDIKYYLESVDPSIDLRRYLKKRVGVNGEIEKRKWGDREIEVIKVDSIAILEG